MFYKNYFTLMALVCFQMLLAVLPTSEVEIQNNNDAKFETFSFVHHKVLSDQIHSNQASMVVPVRKDVVPETILDVGGETENDGKDTDEELINIIDDIFKPNLPLSAEEYIPVFNESSFQNNCSENDSRGPCHETAIHAPTLDQTTIIKASVLFIIGLFSYAGNIATLSSILRMGRQNTSTVYMLLVQLAVADLLVTTFCILIDAAWMLTVQWYGGNFLCKVVKFMQMFSLYLSTFVLVLIGFDRLCAVRFPMGRARAKRDVRKGIVCIWTLSAAFSSPQAAIFSVMRGPFVEDFFQCVTYAFYTAAWQEQLYTMLSLVLMFLLPLLILIATYITTFVTIANQENMFSERACRSAFQDARSKILHKAKVKSLMITVVIVLAFVCCWTPYYVTMIVSIFWDVKAGMTLQTVVFFFGSSTAAINPLIYGAFHLKRRRKSRSSKSTSLNNNSSSSRVETSLMVTLRKGRKSREESNGGHMEFSSPHNFVAQRKLTVGDQTRSVFV